MQSPNLYLKTSSTLIQEPRPLQTNIPVRASELHAGDDTTIGRDDAGFVQGHSGDQETPLIIPDPAAAMSDPAESAAEPGTLAQEDEDENGRGCEASQNATSAKHPLEEGESDNSAQCNESECSINYDAHILKRRKLCDNEDIDFKWVLCLGVAQARNVLESIKTIEGQVKEMQCVIKQAIENHSNNLSFVNRGMWSAAADQLEHNESIGILKDTLKRVKSEMELECGQGTEIWKDFLHLE